MAQRSGGQRQVGGAGLAANNWITSAWAASTGITDLLAALAAGRAWCGSLSRYRGALDMLVDGSVPMGAVSVSSVKSRSLVATATQMPARSTLQVLRGAVDYAGQNGLSGNTKVIGSYTRAQLAGGSVRQAVDTSAGASCGRRSCRRRARSSPPRTPCGC